MKYQKWLISRVKVHPILGRVNTFYCIMNKPDKLSPIFSPIYLITEAELTTHLSQPGLEFLHFRDHNLAHGSTCSVYQYERIFSLRTVLMIHHKGLDNCWLKMPFWYKSNIIFTITTTSRIVSAYKLHKYCYISYWINEKRFILIINSLIQPKLSMTRKNLIHFFYQYFFIFYIAPCIMELTINIWNMRKMWCHLKLPTYIIKTFGLTATNEPISALLQQLCIIILT